MEKRSLVISEAVYSREYAKLRMQLQELLPEGFEDVDETMRLEWLLPPDANTIAALKVMRRMRALTRLTFARMDR